MGASSCFTEVGQSIVVEGHTMYRTGFQYAFDESRRSDLDSNEAVVTLTVAGYARISTKRETTSETVSYVVWENREIERFMRVPRSVDDEVVSDARLTHVLLSGPRIDQIGEISRRSERSAHAHEVAFA